MEYTGICDSRQMKADIYIVANGFISTENRDKIRLNRIENKMNLVSTELNDSFEKHPPYSVPAMNY